MTKPSLASEYHNAKKNYKATKSKCNVLMGLDGKENNRSESQQKKASSLRPAFGPLPAKHSKAETETKKVKRLPLSTDYNTAKLKYKASKARARANPETAIKPRAPREGAGLSSRDRKENASKLKSESGPSTPTACIPAPDEARHQVTAESGLKVLGLVRPIDNKAYEFGLAKGIEVHLVESIKLCGLRKGREKSIVDMVQTLCNHLTNREEEINRWIDFADKVALVAAEKIEQLMQEYHAVCASRDHHQGDAADARKALLSIRKEVRLLKDEMNDVKDGIQEIMMSFPPMMSDFEGQLRSQIRRHLDGVRSECKSEVCDAIDELTASHDEEKQQYENRVGSLESSLQNEQDKVKVLQGQLNDAIALHETEKSKHVTLQKDLMAEVDRTGSELETAIEKIQSLEELLDNEKTQKQEELLDMENKMKAELDDIDARVKQSFKNLVEKKNKEIEEATERARTAEESANAAGKLLSELRASVGPIVSSTESATKKIPTRPLQ